MHILSDVSNGTIFPIMSCSCDWLKKLPSWYTSLYIWMEREFWDSVQPGDAGITWRAVEALAHVPLCTFCTLASSPVLSLEETALWPLRGFSSVNKAVSVRDE